MSNDFSDLMASMQRERDMEWAARDAQEQSAANTAELLKSLSELEKALEKEHAERIAELKSFQRKNTVQWVVTICVAIAGILIPIITRTAL